MKNIKIKKATAKDFEGIWPIFKSVLEAGETFSYSSDTTKREGREIWIKTSVASYVAISDSKVIGAYLLRHNRPGRGSHVANAAFIVDPDSRGLGVGRKLGENALKEAKKLGFKSMQFNFVVSTNKIAVDLWKSLGFKIIGTSPKSFQHKKLGLVDIYIMHKFL